MPTFIALLRGINVGGHRTIPMAALQNIVTVAGGRDVVTYIQSGNVVFAHPSRSTPKLTTQLEAAIAKATGHDVAVILRTAAELAAVIAQHPFAGASPEHLHVSFLASAPPRDALANVDAKAFAPERFALRDRELYLMAPNGLGRSKLAVTLARHKALAAATTRNWRTVCKLDELATAR